MKKILGHLLLVLWFGGTALCSAAELHISSETILRTFQRNTTAGEDKHVLPLHEYLRFDFRNSDDNGVEFHGYGWIRKDLMKSEFYEDDPEGEMLYAYLAYIDPMNPYRISLGRQSIFSGVANENVDGLKVDLELFKHAALSVYGGIPVDLEASSGRNQDAIYGGRLAFFSLLSGTELGVSYKNLQDDGTQYEQTMGMDLYWSPAAYFSMDGRSAYNLETNGWREHNYSAQIQVGDIEFLPNYQKFQYKDYFTSAEDRNNLFRFLFDSEEILTSWGGNVVWRGVQNVELGFCGRHYEYDLRKTSALYLAGLLTLNISPEVIFGAEGGRMDGETQEDNYQLYRAYCQWSPTTLLGPSGEVSVDFLYQRFDEAIYGVDTAFFTSLSAGRSFLKEMLSVKGSLNYSQDPFFDDDLSGIITLLFNY